MATDRTLTSILQAYQTVHNSHETDRILSTTVHLLTTLSNPLNITILTSQLLISPAIWGHQNDSHLWLRIMSIFNTAAITVRQHHLEPSHDLQQQPRSSISCDDWTKAVVKGADEKSPRWRHLLVISGVLLGMEGQNSNGLSRDLRATIERAMITAANLALTDPVVDGGWGSAAIVLALAHSFDLISDIFKRSLNCDALAPIATRAMVGPEGYQEGTLLGDMDIDVKRVPGNRYDWRSQSPSFSRMQTIASRPLIVAMGPLSRLMSFSIHNMASARQVMVVLDEIEAFIATLAKQWRLNKLSEVGLSEEKQLLTVETATVTFPALWQVLKAVMFATVNILRAVISRCMVERGANESYGAFPAARVLHVLRNIYFISSRLGSNTLSAYTFTFLASIDMLSGYPGQSIVFLTQIRPTQAGQIPAHPLDRNLDLFFLNTCEHFTLVLNPEDNESLIVSATMPYLNPGAHQNLLEIFEAAHSAILAVFAAPQNAALTARIIPFYAEALFKAFPTHLSPRQFRFAFKTMMKITTPPAPLSELEPLLADTLLELLRYRAIHAPSTPLPTTTSQRPAEVAIDGNLPPLSEQAILMLTLLDALPTLPCHSLEEWLPLAAELLNLIDDNIMRAACKARFWEVLENGEMDVDRAAICVAWWSSRGGRGSVMFGRRETIRDGEGPYMSGGLGEAKDRSRL